MQKKTKLRKLQLNRETIRHMEVAHGADIGVAIGVVVRTTIKIVTELVCTETCPYSHSIDPPGCCITIPPCNP